MYIKTIKYVAAIAQEGSFSKAAEKLYISQPALSKCIKKLEDELNTPLFERKGNILELTVAGEVFVRDASSILQLYEKMLRRIANLANMYEDTVHFGISPFYSKYYLSRILPSLYANHPAIKVEVCEEHSSTLEQMIINGQLDFCTVPMNPVNPQLEYQVIHQEEIFLAVPKNHPVNAYITPSPGIPYIDLKLVKNEPFIALKKVQKFTEMSQRLCDNAGFTPKVVYETLNWDTVNMFIASGLGVGFVPEILIKSNDSKNQPNYYRLMSPISSRPYAIAYYKGKKLSAAALTIMDYFKEHFSDVINTMSHNTEMNPST